ncbi:MAG TPA: metallophosphoesterase [Polyangiaceae bacterium]
MSAPLVTRRRVLAGGGAVAALGVVDVFGIEPNWLEVSHFDVPVPRLPKSLEGFRIAQVTDSHLQGLGRVEEGIVRTIESENVQAVFLTGDIVNFTEDFPNLKDFCRELSRKNRLLIATLGNWEHWGEIPAVLLAATYANFGIKLLVNDALTIVDAISVVATDDSLTRSDDVARALGRRDRKTDVNLFLTHCPELLDRMPDSAGRFDLSLSGHTHGGQARLGSFAPLVPPGSGRFVSGWYDTKIGRSYVSRGTGMSVLPGRFDCRPELPIFTLRRG